MRHGLRTSVAALCLLGFLAQAGDGLMAVICPPGMEMGGSSAMAEPLPAGMDREGPGMQHPAGHAALESDPEGDPCPFGPGPMALCGAVAPVAGLVAVSVVAGHVVTADAPEVGRIPSSLLSSQLFRPPRA